MWFWTVSFVKWSLKLLNCFQCVFSSWFSIVDSFFHSMSLSRSLRLVRSQFINGIKFFSSSLQFFVLVLVFIFTFCAVFCIRPLFMLFLFVFMLVCGSLLIFIVDRCHKLFAKIDYKNLELTNDFRFDDVFAMTVDIKIQCKCSSEWIIVLVNERKWKTASMHIHVCVRALVQKDEKKSDDHIHDREF